MSSSLWEEACFNEHGLRGALVKQSVLLMVVGRKKAHQFTISCINALHNAHSLNISPSICAFNECAAATLELAYTNHLLTGSFYVSTGAPAPLSCSRSEPVGR